jgi:hypothetical protein
MKNDILKLSSILFILTVFTILICCNNKHWTEEQRKAFETQCSKTETFSNVTILFKGFDNNEFDSILVREYNNTTLLDSFKVFVSKSQSPDEKERKERSATISRTMNIKHKYHFIIPGQKPYELANMKMIMWAQYTMNSEGWGCVMGNYTIDGVKFEHDANPTFIKRDTSITK